MHFYTRCDVLALQWLIDPRCAPSSDDLNAGHALMRQESLHLLGAPNAGLENA